MKKRRQCFAFFAEAEYRFREKRETPLEGGSEREERFCVLFHLLFLFEFLQKGLWEFQMRVLPHLKFPQHSPCPKLCRRVLGVSVPLW